MKLSELLTCAGIGLTLPVGWIGVTWLLPVGLVVLGVGAAYMWRQ